MTFQYNQGDKVVCSTEETEIKRPPSVHELTKRTEDALKDLNSRYSPDEQRGKWGKHVHLEGLGAISWTDSIVIIGRKCVNET